MGRGVDRPRYELVPGVREGSTLGTDRARQRVEQKESPRHLPSSEVAGGGAAPGVRAETRAGRGDDLRDLLDGGSGNSRFFFGEVEGVGGVAIAKREL